jgi:hypothetical protein
MTVCCAAIGMAVGRGRVCFALLVFTVEVTGEFPTCKRLKDAEPEGVSENRHDGDEGDDETDVELARIVVIGVGKGVRGGWGVSGILEGDEGAEEGGDVGDGEGHVWGRKEKERRESWTGGQQPSSNARIYLFLLRGNFAVSPLQCLLPRPRPSTSTTSTTRSTRTSSGHSSMPSSPPMEKSSISSPPKPRRCAARPFSSLPTSLPPPLPCVPARA